MAHQVTTRRLDLDDVGSLIGKHPGRTSPGELTVFKSLGQDSGASGTYSWEMTLIFNPSAVLASAPVPAPTPTVEKKGKGA